MALSKKDMRSIMVKKRSSLSSSEVSAEGEGIYRLLKETGIISANSIVLLFAFYKKEPDTAVIFRMLKDEFPGIDIAYPRVNEDRITMDFYLVNNLSELISGYMGIEEPAAKKERLICNVCNYNNDRQRDIVVMMPGLAFDITGSRIGYGGGFYDRYLKNASDIYLGNIIRIGIGYDFQIMDTEMIVSEAHDIKLDYIITGTHIFNCR